MGNVLSILIENDEMRICELSKSGSTTTVKNAFRAPLPADCVDDGQIIDIEATAKALYAALKSNNIKRGKLAFVIASRKIASKEVILPYVKSAAKLDEMVHANIGEYFPMNNLEDYVIRNTVLETIENAEGKHVNVLVTAVQKQMIRDYYEIAAMLKAPVETVDCYSNSLYQLLRKQLTQGVVLAIQMDDVSSTVSIMRDRTQLFKRSVPYGKLTIVRNLAELKSIDEEEAADILSDPRKLDMEVTPDEYAEIIHDFSSAVTRMAEFHASRNPGVAIEQVRLTGTGINLKGFTEILSRELGTDIVTVKELSGIKIAKNNINGLNYERLADYLPLLGTLYGPMNLKVEEEKKKAESYTVYVALIIVACLCICGVGGFLFYQKHTLQKQRDDLQARIDSYATAEATYQEYLTAQQNYDVLSNYYEGTRNATELLCQMIQDLEKVMPESVGISNLSVNNGTVDITGVSDGKDSLAKFVIELKKIAYISDVRVEDIADTTTELGGKTSTFNMTWQLVLQDDEETAGVVGGDGTELSGTVATGTEEGAAE